MIRFARILFPADLSQQSCEAAPLVAAMAARFDAELLVLHVLEPELSSYPIPAAATHAAVEYDQQDRQTRQIELEALVARFFPGVRAQPLVAEGDIAHCVATLAHEKNIDLIMLPTHGYGRFRRLLLGSVAAKILHDVKCPVWTGVHTDQMWSSAAGWHRFLCGIDEHPRDIPLLQWAAQFAREQHADLHVIHAVHSAAPIPGEDSESLRNFLLDVARERLEKMQASAGTKFDIHLAFGAVSHVVRTAALEQRSDLILVGRGAIQKGFGRQRSSAYAVIREAPCPVISL